MNNIPITETRQQIEALQGLLGTVPQQHEAWEQTLEAIESRLKEDVTRLAVIGTIKSGKSSLTNALLQADLLRRGAGILTAVITRIRYGSRLRAKIRFKSWSSVHEEIQNAFVLLSQAIDASSERTLDLRKKADRSFLKIFLDEHPFRFEKNYNSLNQERILLESFLDGYDSIAEYMEDTEAVLLLVGNELTMHQDFVSKEKYAVYMQDIMLEVPTLLNEKLEIADCQGSDSPNPNHFAKVQGYLAECSFVLYVISSRTGVRQADLIVLRTLQQLGLLHNTIFVSNLDLTEHEDLEDAERVLGQLQVDLSQWVSQPKVFAVSALYQLFDDLDSQRTPRMDAQIRLWQSVPSLVEYHQEQWSSLQNHLSEQTHGAASENLFQGECAHWHYLAQRIQSFIENTRAICSRSYEERKQIEAKLEMRSQELEKSIKSFQRSLDGILDQLRLSVSDDVNVLFDPNENTVVPRIYLFIENYELPSDFFKGEESLNAQIVIFYKNLQSQLLRFVTDELNATLISQLKTLQEQYLEIMQQTCSPFFKLLDETLSATSELTETAETLAPSFQALRFPEIAFVAFSSSLDCSASEKAKSFYLLGKYIIREKITQLKTKKRGKVEYHRHFWEEGLDQLKKDAIESLDFDILNYRENIKYQYLYKGLQVLTEDIQKEFILKVDSTVVDYTALHKDLGVDSDGLGALPELLLPELDELSLRLKELQSQVPSSISAE